MAISYGRGMARKAAYTKKCTCDNPRWSRSHVEVNKFTEEITYVLDCANCKAYWASKSHEMRKYWKPDEVATNFFGYGYDPKDKRTNAERFRELDKARLEYLEECAKRRDEEVLQAQKEAEKAHKAVEKFRKMMEGE